MRKKRRRRGRRKRRRKEGAREGEEEEEEEEISLYIPPSPDRPLLRQVLVIIYEFLFMSISTNLLSIVY